MKVCSDCAFEYDEEFKFCPECGRPFGGEKKKDLERKLNQNLMDMKRDASREAALSRRAFSGRGFGSDNIGPVFGGDSGYQA